MEIKTKTKLIRCLILIWFSLQAVFMIYWPLYLHYQCGLDLYDFYRMTMLVVGCVLLLSSLLIVIIEAIASTDPNKINPINRCASNATMSKGAIKRNTPISSIANAIFTIMFFFSSFIFLYFTLSLLPRRGLLVTH